MNIDDIYVIGLRKNEEKLIKTSFGILSYLKSSHFREFWRAESIRPPTESIRKYAGAQVWVTESIRTPAESIWPETESHVWWPESIRIPGLIDSLGRID